MFKKTQSKRTAIRKTERDVDGDNQQHESLGDEPEINPADVLYLAKVRKKQRITAVPESTEGDGKQYLETIQEGGLSNRDKSSLVEALKHHPTAALFSSSTAAAAAKKRMEDFVESEMKKTRGDSLQEVLERPLPAVAESHSEMLVKFAEKQAREKPSSKSEAAFLADTTLILEKLPEDLKSTTRREQEGNLQSSAAMLTTIQEVDLGIQSKIDNFEMTERARAEDIARNKDRPESDKIGQPVGAWRYGKHQVHPGKTKRETETATDDVVAARFKRYITKR